MSVERLDFSFPFIVFFYGFLVVFVLEIPSFSKTLHQRSQLILQHLEPKRKLAWVCLIVGAFWSLQNLVFT